MVRRELTHKDLEVALALDLAGFQKILHQFEHRDNMAALLWILFVGRQELGQHQNDRSQQTFCGIVEECVLASATVIAVRVDDGLGQDLGILFCLSTGCQILRVVSGDVHVAVDQCQQIVAVRPGRVTQVDDRHIVPIALFRNRSIVTGEVALTV